MSELNWSPAYKVIEDRMKAGDDLLLLIVPFVKLAALQQLHRARPTTTGLKVVCRWRADDVLTGASDVEIFPYLKQAGSQLYINSDIHLKLYVFDSNQAFSTSANLTLQGLGYGANPNIELGNLVTLNQSDWEWIYRIIATSRQVDDAIYARYKALAEQNCEPRAAQVSIDLLGEHKDYTIASLPATETPAKLAAYYFSSGRSATSPEDVRRAAHDLVAFEIPSGLSKIQFEDRLGAAFRASPFVAAFIELIRVRKTLRFGIVNDWIHSKCEDVPLPYRWEIKQNTRILYDWLAHFVPQVTWDRPRHSQVIYWQE